MPLLTNLIVFRRLNRPRLAHRGIRSSSSNCCSVQCELHVSGGRERVGRQARDASHVTPHQEASKRTGSQRRLISSQVSKRNFSPLLPMVMPSSAEAASLISTADAAARETIRRSWRICWISCFTASLMPLILPCSTHVSNNNYNNNPPALTKKTAVTLQLPFSPSAIKRPPTSVKPLSICITSCYTPLPNLSPVSPTTCTSHSCIHSAALLPPPFSHMPLLTKLIFFRRLNRPRLAHSGIRSSSFNCCSVQCELHVSGEREGFRRQARDASHVTPHQEADKCTSALETSIFSQVSKSKKRHDEPMATPLSNP